MACRYETDLEETLVAQELATSSTQRRKRSVRQVLAGVNLGSLLTGTIVEGVKEREEGTDHEDVGVLVENHFGEWRCAFGFA